MASAGTVTVDFAAETAKFTAELKKVRQDVGRIKDEVSSANRVIQGFGDAFKGLVTIAAFTTAVRAVAQATAESERAIALLNNALGSTNANVAAASADMQAFAAELQRTTTFGDEAVIGVETLLLSFQGLSGETVKRATAAVLDLSTRMGIDAPQAAKLLGKALADPEKGMVALTRAGVLFSDQQKQQISSLKDSGDAAGAQGVILGELERRFGGAAAAARNTLGGALEGLKNNFGELLELKTGVPGVVKSVNELSNVLADPQIKAAADTLFGGLVKAAAAAATGIAAVTNTIVLAFDAEKRQTEELRVARESLARATNAGADPESLQRIRSRIVELQAAMEEARIEKASLAILNGSKGPSSRFVSQPTSPTPVATTLSEDQISAMRSANQTQLQLVKELNAESFAIVEEAEQQRLRSAFDAETQLQQGRMEIERETQAETSRIAAEQLQEVLANAEQRFAIERDLQERVTSLRRDAFGAAVSLLQSLGTKNKAFAVAAIALETAQRAISIVASTNAAAAAALLPPPIGLGPLAGAGLAAKITAAGYVNAALTAALGGAQIAQISRPGGNSLGSPANPVFTDRSTGEERTVGAAARPSTQLYINFNGAPYDAQTRAVIDKLIAEIKDRDVVIIPSNSRQAMEIREGR
jgi:hypothetical protein